MATKEDVQEAVNLWEKGEVVPGKATTIQNQISCDMCFTPAIVDGKTLGGNWANMCTKHFFKLGVGLGVGRGQVLIWKRDV